VVGEIESNFEVIERGSVRERERERQRERERGTVGERAMMKKQGE